ncbi:MAG: OsmC family protein [Bacteroidetes bacterium]|nr:OsmC family protein [Bacteroidota bacterium]
MITSKVTYKGELRTEATHLQSGNTIITDAPKDNHGKGEAFSPTDLVSTALGSCMFSIMGIACNTHDIKGFEGTTVEITKIMAQDPRRIVKIIAHVQFVSHFTDKEKRILEHAALTCPVAKSLHPDIEQAIDFVYPE